MFSLAVLIPSPPVLVPELGGGRPDVDDEHPAVQVSVLREAVQAAAHTLAGATRHWTIVGVSAVRPGGGGGAVRGVGSQDGAPEAISRADAGSAGFGADAVGTFRGYGADVRVALSDTALADGASPDPGLPLPVLIGGWVRGQVGQAAVARARLVDGGAPAGRCIELGAGLRRELDAAPEPCGVLVVADGANTLSSAAPGFLDPRAAGVQERIDRALDAGDCAALAALDIDLCAELGVSGRAAYQVLAGLFDASARRAGAREPHDIRDSSGHSVQTLYRAAPFGVGYHVSVWRGEGAR